MVIWRKISWRKMVWAAVYRLLQAAALVLTLVAILLALSYGSGGFRSRLVSLGLGLAADAVPGDLSVGRFQWPELGHLILTDVIWTDGQSPPQTLLALASLEVAWDIEALVQRHVRIDSVIVVAQKIDVPGLQRLLTTAEVSTAEVETTASEGFLHAGALPGIPSLGVDLWRVSGETILLSPELKLAGVRASGSLELGYGHQAGALVDQLAVLVSLAKTDSTLQQPLVFAVEDLALAAQFSVQTTGKIAVTLDRLELDFGELAVASLASYAGLQPGNNIDEKISGRLLASGSFAPPMLASMFDLNLERTAWLEQGRIVGRAMVDMAALPDSGLSAVAAKIDSVVFAYLGTTVWAKGQLQRQGIDLHLKATVPDSQAVMLVWPDSLRPPVVSLDLEATVSGSPKDFELSLTLVGSVDLPQVTVPQLELRARGSSVGGELELHLSDGFSMPAAGLDSLLVQMSFERASNEVLRGAFALAARRGKDVLRAGGRAMVDSLSRASAKTVVLDSLVVEGRGQTLRLQEPSTLTMGPEPGHFSVSAFEFSGPLGHISLGGEISRARIDFGSSISLYASEQQLNLMLPNDFWSANGGKDFTLESQLDLGGTFTAPTLAGHLLAKLISHRQGPDLGVSVDFSLASGDSAGVVAILSVTTADSLLLRAELEIPGGIDAELGGWRTRNRERARLKIPRQTLNLEQINRVMPAEVDLVGEITAGLEVVVPMNSAAADSSEVNGVLASEGFRINLPNQSRIDAVFELKASGTLEEVKLAGEITINSAFIRLPELPQNVHDIEGESALWSLAAADSLAVESSEVFEADILSYGPSLRKGSAMPWPDLDIRVHLPDKFRVRGYGLDIELAGELQVSRGYDEDNLPQPKVDGHLRTVLGTLKFMNRTFEVERGDIIFTGLAPPNPTLSLILTTEVNGTLVRIMITGQADDPVIELSSEPDYGEADIIAVLLFGQPMNELDNDQRGGVRSESDPGQELRQNLAGLAMALGTAGMQNSMSGTMGVDMVEVGADSDGESTLMVGKFLNPRLMVKYHHSLTKSGTYFVTVEYTLSRVFRLISTYGQGEEDSGLELTWRRRY